MHFPGFILKAENFWIGFSVGFGDVDWFAEGHMEGHVEEHAQRLSRTAFLVNTSSVFLPISKFSTLLD